MREDSHFAFRLPALAGVFFLIIGISAETGGGKSMIDFNQYQWKNRLLLFFAPQGDEPAFKTLKAEIGAQAEGAQERDLLIGEVLEQGASYFAGIPIDPQSADDLRRRFSVREGRFTVLLIGKDGGLKMRKENPTALAEIFTLIDSMPMRRQEMQERK